MISNESIRKLMELNLPEVVEIVKLMEINQLEYITLSFDQKIDMVVDYLYQQKYNQAVIGLKKRGHLRFPSADIRDIYYTNGRALNRQTLESLMDCAYITNHVNLVLHGPCGTGKTWIACALANEAAKKKLKIFYIRTPKLFESYKEERKLGKPLSHIVKKYAKYDLLILDEWLMYDLDSTDLQFIAELIEVRYDNSSTIFCSQYSTTDWYEKLGATTLTEALLDRIVHNMININMGIDNFRQKK